MSALLITNRKYSGVIAPTYVHQEGGVITLEKYHTISFTIHAERGVTYGLATTGAAGLEVIITGPGLSQPLKTTVGGLASFTAPSRGVYSVLVQSPELNNVNPLITGPDRPFSGPVNLELYSNVFDDVGLMVPQSLSTNGPKVITNVTQEIKRPSYDAGAQRFDKKVITIEAEAGDYYGITTKGADGLKVTVTGPGMIHKLDDGTTMEVPMEGAIGDNLGFRAEVAGTYTITVESAVVRTGFGDADQPNYGIFSVEVQHTDMEGDASAMGGSALTAGNKVAGRLGTASDVDQIYGTLPSGVSVWSAAYSDQVRDLTIDVVQGRNDNPLKTATAKDGMAVMSFTSHAADSFGFLLRSGSYYQVGDYEVYGGQRLAPSNTLSVAKPRGDTLTFNDSVGREVWAWSGDTTITTGSGDDVLVGSMDGNDTLSSGAGADSIYVGGGMDIVDGGAGRDVVYFMGIKEFVSFSNGMNGLTLSGTLHPSNGPAVSSTARLTNVEFVQFLNGTYEVAKERFLSGIVHFDKPGNDSFKGGKTPETIVFDGLRHEFSVTLSGSGQGTVVDRVGSGGVNSVRDVETLLFDNVGVQIDFAGTNGKSSTFNEMGTAGKSAAAILAIWGRDALWNKTLAGTVVDFFKDGADAEDAAFLADIMGVLTDAVGSKSNATILDHLYKNVVGVPITTEQHMDLMGLFSDPEFTHADLLELAFEQPTLQQQIKLMGVWDSGLEFIAPAPLVIPE